MRWTNSKTSLFCFDPQFEGSRLQREMKAYIAAVKGKPLQNTHMLVHTCACSSPHWTALSFCYNCRDAASLYEPDRVLTWSIWAWLAWQGWCHDHWKGSQNYNVLSIAIVHVLITCIYTAGETEYFNIIRKTFVYFSKMLVELRRWEPSYKWLLKNAE